MINLRLEIQNPFSKDRFKNLGSLSGRLTKNKFWEVQHTFYDGMLLDVDFSIKRRCDHAGVFLVLGLLTYAVHISIYDNRHWDYENNQWKVHD